MPKYELKEIQRELETGFVWPVYYLFGPERFKIRELVKKLRVAVLGSGADSAKFHEFREDRFYGGEVTAQDVLSAAESIGFSFAMGGMAESQGAATSCRLITVQEAHLLKNIDLLESLLGKRGQAMDLSTVLILTAKDLDGRKKFSKTLVERAAVVECTAISEQEREPWIQYLARQKKLIINESQAVHLLTLEPWSLDCVDQELEKFSLFGSEEGDRGTGLDGLSIEDARDQILPCSDRFLSAFFGRQLMQSMRLVQEIATQPQEALPLLGSCAWNVRQLIQIKANPQSASSIRAPHFILERLRNWQSFWSMSELLALQNSLFELDFQTKQTPHTGIGSWGTLVAEHCLDG